MKKRKFVLLSTRGLAHTDIKTKKSMKRTAILAVFVVAACVALGFVVSRSGYAVCLDGEVVGVARNGQEVNRIIEKVEDNVSELLGYDYEMESDIELSGSVKLMAKTNLTDVFMRSVDEIAYASILEIDGTACAATLEETTIRDAIAEIVNRYCVCDGSTVTFGNVITVRSEFVPVGELLSKEDIISIIDPACCGDFALSVLAVVSETHREEVEFPHEYHSDPDTYEGTDTILVPGVNGLADITEKIEYVNGVEVSRTETERIMIEEPVCEVVSVGAKYKPRWISTGSYIWPCGGWVSSYFGYRDVTVGSTYHRALDIAEYIGAPILAADGGTVTYSGYWDEYGLAVEIQHDNGEVTRYAHCNALNVSEGDKVAQGDVIAYMGETGTSAGVHLHFEIRVDGEPIDPLERLPD